jgi:3-polyprenyl-4-hydroxybenzoate decarboxylase
VSPVPSPEGYRDLRAHLAALRERNLVWVIDREVNKDTELHPLVRWQYRGGLAEEQWKAFLFTNVVDSRGRRYANPVLVGGLAGSPEIYATGLQCEVAEVGARWAAALANPIEPVLVDSGPVTENIAPRATTAGSTSTPCRSRSRRRASTTRPT